MSYEDLVGKALSIQQSLQNLPVSFVLHSQCLRNPLSYYKVLLKCALNVTMFTIFALLHSEYCAAKVYLRSYRL